MGKAKVVVGKVDGTKLSAVERAKGVDEVTKI